MKKLKDCMLYEGACKKLGEELVGYAFELFMKDHEKVIEEEYDIFLDSWEITFFAGFLPGLNYGLQLEIKDFK